jgi:PGF-CTERM protein
MFLFTEKYTAQLAHMIESEYLALGAAILVVLAGLAGAVTAATQDAGSSVSIETSPTDPNDGAATHTVVFTPSLESALVGSTFDDIRINYSVDQPTADVSNVGAGTIERIGIDRGGDDPGTRIDVEATITEVSGAADGSDVEVSTNGQLDITSGDEIVVVLRPVQNPQNSGTARAGAVVNTESTADSATDTVTYEYDSAYVNVTDQSTSGSTITVADVNVSEPGYVVISNQTGRNPAEVRGAAFVEPGDNRTDVQVDIDPPVRDQTELRAQVHLDTNGDLLFNYSRSGGEVDGPFETRDGNVMASESATVWRDDRTRTPSGDDPEISNYEATADGGEVTVSFDSDRTLADIEVDVTGPEDAALTTEDFDGNQYDGYEASYDAEGSGEYTTELVTAEDSAGNDGADDGDFADSATVEGSGDGTATPTASEGTDTVDTPTSSTPNTPTVSAPSDTEPATDETPTGGVTADADDETASPTDEDAPGFGGIVALVALVAGALLFARRR